VSVARASRLLVEYNRGLTDRGEFAYRIGSLVWLADVVEQKRLIRDVLRELAREAEPGAGLTIDLTVRVVGVTADSWEQEQQLRRRLADPETRDRVLEAVERALDELADEGDA
jgi:hypothetical protein